MERNTRNRKRKNEISYFDYSLLFITVFMICFGLVILYSASSYEASIHFNNSKYYLNKQLTFVIIGSILSVFVVKMDYHIYKKPMIALGIYFGSILLSLLVITPLGVEANGATRWVGVGFFTLQVCEVVKVAVIIFMAFAIDRVARKIKKPGVFIACLLIVLVPVAVIVLITKDLSSGIVIAAIGIVMLFIACHKLSYFLIIGGMGVIAFIGAVILEPFRIERFKAWLNPEKYSDEGGYQILQSLYSLGSGGIFGKGLGKGIQKLGYIPEAQNDMIFTVVCEELGIVGGIALILMFIFMIWRCMIIANNAPDLFGSLIVIGVMIHIAVQSIMNIAVVTNSMPNTGVTLPFMSYGGTSILCLIIEIGLVLSVSKRIKVE